MRGAKLQGVWARGDGVGGGSTIGANPDLKSLQGDGAARSALSIIYA
jgi:hypothetical protein